MVYKENMKLILESLSCRVYAACNLTLFNSAMLSNNFFFKIYFEGSIFRDLFNRLAAGSLSSSSF